MKLLLLNIVLLCCFEFGVCQSRSKTLDIIKGSTCLVKNDSVLQCDLKKNSKIIIYKYFLPDTLLFEVTSGKIVEGNFYFKSKKVYWKNGVLKEKKTLRSIIKWDSEGQKISKCVNYRRSEPIESF